MMLTEPLPGQETKVTAQTEEQEGDLFMAALAQHSKE